MTDYRPNSAEDPIDYPAIVQRVRRRIRRKLLFGVHTLLFTLFTLFVLLKPTPYWWPLNVAVFVAWLAVWIAHTVWFLYQTAVDRGVQREIAREMQLRNVRAGKAKRRAWEGDQDEEERLDRLAEEAEPVNLDELLSPADPGAAKRKRGRP